MRRSERMRARPAAPSKGGEHNGRQLRGVDGDGVRRAGKGHEAGADAQRPARAHAGGPGVRLRSRDDKGMAAAVLVALELRPGENAPPTAPARWPRSARGYRQARPRGCRCRRRSAGPQSRRPGISRWPGLRRKKVTVRVASTTGPRARPVLPSRPLGTSTASTSTGEALRAAMTSAAIPAIGRASPDPNKASTTISAPAMAAGESAATSAPQRCAMTAASPLSALGAPSRARRHLRAPLAQVAGGDEPHRRRYCPARTGRRPPGRLPAGRGPRGRRRVPALSMRVRLGVPATTAR